MDKFKKLGVVAMVSLALTAFAAGCGDDEDDELPGTPFNDPNASTGLGNFTFECGGQSGQQQQQQQKQVPFKQQQQQSCGKQKFEFKQAVVDDFNVRLDCDAREVTVSAKGNQQQQQTTLPIQEDGTVKGKLTYPQQMQSDNRGNTVCWVEYNVEFDGKAQCDAPASPSEEAAKDKLELRTLVDLSLTTSEQLEEAGVAGGPGPSPSPSVSPSPSPSPSASASPSPTPSASASPSPSPSASPLPSRTPVVICIVEDPCPMEGTTEVSCDQ